MLFQRQDIVSQSVSDQVAVEALQRRMRIKKAWDRYNGIYPKPLKETKGDPLGDDNITLNLCRLVVDTSAFFLFGKGVTFEVESDADDAAQTWLDECWAENDSASLLLDLALNGGVSGDAFLKIQQPGPGRDYPRIMTLDPANVSAIWAPDDYQNILEYRVEWSALEPNSRKIVAYRQVITPENGFWHIADYESRGDAKGWTLVSEEDWRYRFAPIFHAKNRPAPNSYYGTADLEDDVIDANEDYNRTVSSTQRTIRHHAHPKTWGRGLRAADLDMSPDSVTLIQSQTGELKNLEMQSDLSASREFAKELKEAFHQIASVPEIAAGKFDAIGQLSGLALSILYGPLIRLTETKEVLYGEMLVKLNRALLEMRAAGSRDKVSLKWPQILPKDPKAEADAALSKQAAGVSRATTLAEMGYDPDDEADKVSEEKQTAADMGESLLTNFERGGMSDPATGGASAQEGTQTNANAGA